MQQQPTGLSFLYCREAAAMQLVCGLTEQRAIQSELTAQPPKITKPLSLGPQLWVRINTPICQSYRRAHSQCVLAQNTKTPFKTEHILFPLIKLIFFFFGYWGLTQYLELDR